MDIKQKNEVEIDDSNLKDFLEQDLEGIGMILNSEDFISDLAPIPIEKKVKHKESEYKDFFYYYRKNYKKDKSLKV